MNFNPDGFLIGMMFGAALILSGLANPDKIIGTLRLKDLHALRVIAVFVLVGMFGMFVLWLGHGDQAHFDVKTAAILGNLLGGALLGIGFGLTGYCPGTGLACAAAGRIDAMIAVAGMLAGALVYILTFGFIGNPVNKVWNYGKPRLPEVTGIPYWVWVIVLVGVGVLVLGVTAGRGKRLKD